MSDFNWIDDESIVVRPFEGIAVYTNMNDDIVLRQSDSDDVDKIIIIPKEHGVSVIEAIQAEMFGDG